MPCTPCPVPGFLPTTPSPLYREIPDTPSPLAKACLPDHAGPGSLADPPAPRNHERCR
jgi:hypothetical protein